MPHEYQIASKLNIKIRIGFQKSIAKIAQEATKSSNDSSVFF